MACVTPFRLAVALNGAGWDPAAGRAPDANAQALLTAAAWAELAQEAEGGKLDFVTFEDAFAPGSDRALDATRIAARVAPLTSRIGLVPTVTTSHPEPLHISTAIATLDDVSSGRAGWLAQPGRPGEACQVGRRDDLAELLDDAADVVAVVRRLQRQPVVMASGNSLPHYRFAARSADVVLVRPFDEDDVRLIVDAVRAEESAIGRLPGSAPAGSKTQPPLRIFADLAVFLDDTEAAAAARKARLDDLAEDDFDSETAVFVGTPSQLVRRLQGWQRAGIEGFRLRPGALPHDLHAITRGLVPALQENDAFRRGYEARNLRALLGLPRPANRYPARSTTP